MGVPKFYRWISERYPCLSEVVKDYQVRPPIFARLFRVVLQHISPKHCFAKLCQMVIRMSAKLLLWIKPKVTPVYNPGIPHYPCIHYCQCKLSSSYASLCSVYLDLVLDTLTYRFLHIANTMSTRKACLQTCNKVICLQLK